MFNEATIGFLKKLATNNHKTWFDAHRPAYLEAKADFERFVSEVLSKLTSIDNDLKDIEVKDCTFRLNRDIRFSKDKTPYKTNMGASFNRGEKNLYLRVTIFTWSLEEKVLSEVAYGCQWLLN